MRAYVAFTKKEFCEMYRGYKVLIMGIVFLILGLMNPLTAKFTPELAASFMPDGMNIQLAAPVMADSWLQFFKNVTQIGLFVLVIALGGTLAGELSKGTLINILTKGMKRRTVILSKFTSMTVLWSSAYVLCFLITWLYTCYFWSERAHAGRLLTAVACIWFFGELLLSALLLGSVLFTGYGGTILFTGCVVIFLFTINIVPKVQYWNPVFLISRNMEVFSGNVGYLNLLKCVSVCAAAAGVFLLIACKAFDKKKL